METRDDKDAFWLSSSEDDALLGALLRFIENNIEESQFPVSVADSGPPHVRPSKMRRHEIRELREEVHRLETTISTLRSQEEAKIVVSDIRDALVSSQRSQLQKAEEENHLLQELVREQDALVEQIKHLTSERAVRVKRTPGLEANIGESVLSSFQDLVTNDTDVLESVTSALRPMSLQTEWVLAHPELKAADLVSDGYCAFFKKLQGVARPALHVTDSRVVPFDLEATSAAVWGNLVHRLGSFHEAYTSTSKVLRTQHEEVVEIPGFRGIIRITMALQRFEEENRVVFVRSSIFTYLDPDGRNSHVVFPGLSVRHSHWTIVQRLPSPKLTASRIQTLGISIPVLLPNSETHTVAVDRFLTDLSLQFCEFTNEDVDNRLLSGKGTSPYPSVAMFENVT